MTDFPRPIGIISALPKELALISARAEIVERLNIGGFEVARGTIDGVAVLLALSVPGKVNAASLATLMASTLSARALLFSGVAGGLNPNRQVLDLLVAERVIQHDYGAIKQSQVTVYRPGAYTIGPVVEPIDYVLPPELQQKLSALGDVDFGTVLTGDLFINCEVTRKRLHRDLGGDAVEMEGGAVAQVAERFGIPWVIVRALSDLAGDDSDLDFDSFATAAAEKAAALTLRILRVL